MFSSVNTSLDMNMFPGVYTDLLFPIGITSLGSDMFPGVYI